MDKQSEEAVEKALQSMERDVKRRAKLCAAEIEQAKAEERERCADVCEEMAVQADRFGIKLADKPSLIQAQAYRFAAKEIRGGK
jgi:hypothetical protein